MRTFLIRFYYQTFHLDKLEFKQDMVASSLEVGALVPALNWRRQGQLRYLGERWFLFEPTS